MAIWLVRAGSSGEYENKFLSEKRIYLTWGNLSQDLSKVSDKKEGNYILKSTSQELGITQKSAWYMLQRIREACGSFKLSKVVEVDETYIGGKEKKQTHKAKKLMRVVEL